MLRKGALTVEASIVLPVFMLVILSLAMAMRVYLAYEKVEFAVFKTGMQISEKAYILKMAGLIPQESEYGQNVISFVDNLESGVSNIESSFEGVKNNIGGLKNPSFNSWNGIVSFIKQVEESILSIQNLFNTVVGTFNSLKEGFSSITNVKDFKGWLKDLMFSHGTALALNAYVEHSIKKELGSDIKTYIMDDFKLNGSKYFTSLLELENGSVKSNERALMLIDVKYKVKIPMAFMYGKFDGIFEGHTRQVFRAWVGD